MKKITLINRKGGVGKTTTTYNLAHILASKGYKVLCIDLDSQCNLSQAFDVNLADTDSSLDQLLLQKSVNFEDVAKIIVQYQDNIGIIYSKVMLSYTSVKLATKSNKETRLKRILNLLDDYFDYCLIDVAPSLDDLTINALVSSDSMLVITSPSKAAIDSTDGLIGIYEHLVKEEYNPDLNIDAIVFNMYNEQSNLPKQYLELLKEKYNNKYPIAKINKSIYIEKAISEHISPFEHPLMPKKIKNQYDYICKLIE